MRLVKISIPT